MNYFFGGNVDFEFLNNEQVTLLEFNKEDDLRGKVLITSKNSTKQIPHNGIHITLVGAINIISEDTIYTFYEQQYTASRGGILFVQTTFPPRPYHEQEVYVTLPIEKLPITPTVDLDLCVDRMLHCAVHLRTSSYNVLNDTIQGDIVFRILKTSLRSIELHLLRKEQWDDHSKQSVTILKRFEVMDGAPLKGEKIPIRFPLKGIDLTPTYHDVAGVFAVNHYISIVVIDYDERRYYSETPIIFHKTKQEIRSKQHMKPPTVSYNLDKLSSPIQPTIKKFESLTHPSINKERIIETNQNINKKSINVNVGSNQKSVDKKQSSNEAVIEQSFHTNTITKHNELNEQPIVKESNNTNEQNDSNDLQSFIVGGDSF
ncbi:vacuolar protein sorting-associated protein [Entamoeba marina]